MAITVGDICKIVLAVLLPPLGVFAEKERCDKDVLINILLTVLGYIPGRSHPSAVCYSACNCWHLLLSFFIASLLSFFTFALQASFTRCISFSSIEQCEGSKAM